MMGKGLYFTFDYDCVLIPSDVIFDNMLKEHFPTVKQIDDSYSWYDRYSWADNKQYMQALKAFDRIDYNTDIPEEWVFLINSLLNQGAMVNILTAREDDSLSNATSKVRKAFGKSVRVIGSNDKANIASVSEIDMHLDDSPDVFKDFQDNHCINRLCVFGCHSDYGLSEIADSYVTSCEGYTDFLNDRFNLDLVCMNNALSEVAVNC